MNTTLLRPSASHDRVSGTAPRPPALPPAFLWFALALAVPLGACSPRSADCADCPDAGRTEAGSDARDAGAADDVDAGQRADAGCSGPSCGAAGPVSLAIEGETILWMTAARDGDGAVLLATSFPSSGTSGGPLATRLAMAIRLDASLGITGARAIRSGTAAAPGKPFLHTRSAIRRGTNAWFLLRLDGDPDAWTLARVPDVGEPRFIRVPRPLSNFYDDTTAILVNVPDGVMVAMSDRSDVRTELHLWVFDDAGNELRRWSPGGTDASAPGGRQWRLTDGTCDASGRVYLVGEQLDDRVFLTTFPSTAPGPHSSSPRFTTFVVPPGVESTDPRVLARPDGVLIAARAASGLSAWITRLDVPESERPSIRAFVTLPQPVGLDRATLSLALAGSAHDGEVQVVMTEELPTGGSPDDGCVVANVRVEDLSVRSATLNRVLPEGTDHPDCLLAHVATGDLLVARRVRPTPDFLLVPVDADGRADEAHATALPLASTARALPEPYHDQIWGSPPPVAPASAGETEPFSEANVTVEASSAGN